MRRSRWLRIVALMIYLGAELGEREACGGEFTGATEWTQLANNAQLVNITAQTLQQLQQQIQQTQAILQNSRSLNQALYSDVFTDIMTVQQAVQVGQGLAYSQANLDSQWNSTYHNAGYTDGQNYPGLYKTWAQTSLDSTRGTMNAVVGQGQAFESDAEMVRRLQQQAQSGVTGSLQAEQVLNQLVSQLLGEMQKLRQLMLSDLQSKEAWQAQQIQETMAAQDLVQPAASWGQTDINNMPYDGRTFPDDYMNTLFGTNTLP